MTTAETRMLASIDERWQNLTIENDFVFCKTMLDPELCREVLEAILGFAIDRIEYVERQGQYDAEFGGKSIRLDVYARDGKGTVYNVEMQSANTRELPQRSRYYHALLALDQLRRGESYRQLKDTYVIFVCNFDLFGEGQRVYFFENSCRGQESLRLGDGTKTVFLAANAPKETKGDGRLDEFLDFISSGEVSGELSAKLAAGVANVLDNRKWRLEFMMLEIRDQLNFERGEKLGHQKGLEQGLELGHEKGLAEGLEQGREAGLTEGLEQGRKAGEDRLAHLVAALVEDGRNDELTRILGDGELRETLYRAYGIGE